MHKPKGLQIVGVMNQEYALFSQVTSDPIPYHMPTIKNRLGGQKPFKATINGIKAPAYNTNYIFIVL